MAHAGATADRSQQGFTLIEMLVAIMILSFVALGIAGLFSHAVINNASGYDYAQLATEARFAMEELQGLVDYSRSPDHTSSPAIDPLFNSTGITNEAGGLWPDAQQAEIHKVIQQGLHGEGMITPIILQGCQPAGLAEQALPAP